MCSKNFWVSLLPRYKREVKGTKVRGLEEAEREGGRRKGKEENVEEGRLELRGRGKRRGNNGKRKERKEQHRVSADFRCAATAEY